MKIKPVFVTTTIVLCVSSYSQITKAETIRYKIAGTVSDVSAPLQGGPVSVGDSVKGFFFANTIPTSDNGSSAWYGTTDLVLDIGQNYQLTATTGAIQVDNSDGRDDNISFHITDRAHGLIGPQINSNWSPDYFNQHIWSDLESVSLPSTIYDGNQNVRTRSLVRFNIDDSVEISIDLIKITVDDPEPSLPTVYYNIASVEDINGNGYPELAFLRTVPSGNVHVLLRDAGSREYLKTITFFNDSYEPLDVASLPDINGNGSQEIAAMALNLETGRTRTVVKDSVTEERLSVFNFKQ